MKYLNKIAYPVFIFLSLLGFTDILAQKPIPKKDSQKLSKPLQASYEKYIDENTDNHLKEFLALISIPSISSIPANKPDVEKTAAWLVNKLKSIGISNAKQLTTDGNPVVYANWNEAPGKPTVLIYGHYDVQPVKESEWDNPPFSPIIKEGKIYGRGASDDKSGIITAICAIEAILHTDGKLPVNVKFLFEGEEEIGSPNFKKFLEKNKELLKTDFAVTADDIQYSETDPAITLSLRGAAQLEFSVKTANTDAHSGQFGGKTPNAVLAMSQIISSLYDKVGNVAVDGFYDKVLPITAAQKEMIKRIPYDASTDMKILGTTAEVGDPAFSPQERMWYRPTLEIIGMQGGYTAAEGHSNIIPSHAMARITCRLVNNQTGQEIVDLIMAHIKKNCPVGATVSFKFKPGYASPMQYPTDTKGFQYVSDALTAIYGKQPLQMATGGSGGAMLSFKETLGVYAYSLGFELPDEKWHASNEFFRVSSFKKGQLVYCYFLQHLAEEESKLKK
jgi:acetylornithine deacetylase/succinyl-diaminopimelate desuccinylase-like protein